MNRFSKIVLLSAVFVPTVVSCVRGARVIPPRKMQKIYCEMLLADQWLDGKDSLRRRADTTFFYEPIFEKYGYTVEDYRRSVDHYLDDPERYVELLEKVAGRLSKDAAALNASLEAERRARFRMDSLLRVRAGFKVDTLKLYRDFSAERSLTEEFLMRTDSRGIYLPNRIARDTVSRNPRKQRPRDTIDMPPILFRQIPSKGLLR